jgi:hypothetical protein
MRKPVKSLFTGAQKYASAERVLGSTTATRSKDLESLLRRKHSCVSFQGEETDNTKANIDAT